MTMADTAQERTGPLPNWIWAVVVFVLAAGYLIYRKKNKMNQQAANPTSSSTGGVTPISNLTTQYVPMPNMAGDTFVNIQDTDNQGTPSSPLAPPGKPSGSLPPGTNPAAPTYAGWNYLPTYTAFDKAVKAGKTVDYSVNGGPLQPFYQGGKLVGQNPPSGSRWFVKS